MIAHIAKLHFASARFLLRPPTGENREYKGLSGNFLKKGETNQDISMGYGENRKREQGIQ
jgi:hypothetical protein